VGPSGIGKSTLAALIAGLLSPTAGTIRVDGHPAGDPAGRVLIPQEAYVFTGTLHQNLTYLAPGADDAAVRRAADAVGLTRLVQEFGGYSAVVDPAALTEGQRQLIALCRAYLAPAPLIVLDEAAYRLDAAAEARAEEAFARRPGTLVIIAHRVSSAMRARRVLVLDGTHAHVGRHPELATVSPLYRDLLGRWDDGAELDGSEPPGLFCDPDGVHPVPRTKLAVDTREMITDRADRQDESVGDLRRGSAP